MSEEIIKQQFEEIVEESRQEDVYEYYIKLRNMLDLYNKEKEQNSLIKEKLKELNIPMETLIGEFNRLEDLEDDTIQLKWRLKEEKENYDKLTKHFIENHISKDKIREIINVIRNRNYNDYTYAQDGNEVKEKIMFDIQELLEEK